MNVFLGLPLDQRVLRVALLRGSLRSVLTYQALPPAQA